MEEILFADDDLVLRKNVAELLEQAGYAVARARNGEEALTKFAAHHPDLALLDIEMPKKNGFAVCQEMRRVDKLMPIIFLTANDSEINEVKAMGIGADDFIAKFAGGSVEEWNSILLARIARALDRASAYGRPAGVIALGKVQVNLDSRIVTDNGAEIMLSPAEGNVLKALAARRGRYLGVDELMSAAFGERYSQSDAAIYAHISRIRHKLGPAADMIVSDRSRGYCLLK